MKLFFKRKAFIYKSNRKTCNSMKRNCNTSNINFFEKVNSVKKQVLHVKFCISNW